jgi:hypothetical protein
LEEALRRPSYTAAIIRRISGTKRKVRSLSDAEEARIQAGIAADPDNPEWTARDFRRASPFGKVFSALARNWRAPAGKPRTGGK